MRPTAKQARTKARRVREQHGLTLTEPIRDLLGLVERGFGVTVVILESLADIAGAYIPRPGGPVILLNGSDAAQRLRFTLAHELGHHVFHDERREDTHAGLARPGHWIEVRANSFAAELLMPVEAVKVPSAPVAVDDVCALADRFGVSLIAACIRLHTCGADTESVDALIRGDDERLFRESRFSDSLSDAKRALPRVPAGSALEALLAAPTA